MSVLYNFCYGCSILAFLVFTPSDLFRIVELPIILVLEQDLFKNNEASVISYCHPKSQEVFFEESQFKPAWCPKELAYLLHIVLEKVCS